MPLISEQYFSLSHRAFQRVPNQPTIIVLHSVKNFHSSIFKSFKSLAKLSEGSNFVSAWYNATASVVASNIESFFYFLFTFLFIKSLFVFLQKCRGGETLCQPGPTQQPVWALVAASNIEPSFQTSRGSAKDSTWASPIQELKNILHSQNVMSSRSIFKTGAQYSKLQN